MIEPLQKATSEDLTSSPSQSTYRYKDYQTHRFYVLILSVNMAAFRKHSRLKPGSPDLELQALHLGHCLSRTIVLMIIGFICLRLCGKKKKQVPNAVNGLEAEII